MPQHKSAEKRVRQSEKRRLRNRVHKSRVRTMIKKVKLSEDKDSALVLLNDAKAYLDRLSAKGVIHNNMAANVKSKLDRHVNALA
ncbi:MAG: 30S ribosomal protein S20 [Bacteroidetes Order II. Incertae sedis bacterium]|nr:30S ribosomal protein S20 [Bacteroidetes Order II. bacterium]